MPPEPEPEWYANRTMFICRLALLFPTDSFQRSLPDSAAEINCLNIHSPGGIRTGICASRATDSWRWRGVSWEITPTARRVMNLQSLKPINTVSPFLTHTVSRITQPIHARNPICGMRTEHRAKTKATMRGGENTGWECIRSVSETVIKIKWTYVLRHQIEETTARNWVGVG